MTKVIKKIRAIRQSPVEKVKHLKKSTQHKNKDDLAHERVKLFLDAYLQGYKNGEIQFEVMCRKAAKVLKCILTEKSHSYWRNKYMGWITFQALDCTPVKRSSDKKGEIMWVRTLCAELVQMARKVDGYPITRITSSGNITAYDKVVEVMCEYGAPVTVSQVERWHREYKN